MSDSHLTTNNRSENRQTAISDPSIDVSKGVMFLPWALLTGDFKVCDIIVTAHVQRCSKQLLLMILSSHR